MSYEVGSNRNLVQERTKGTCITAFRSGDAIAAIMCRLSKKNRPYLAWYPLTAYRYNGSDKEQVSRFIFAEHGKDMEVVNKLATEFLEKWNDNPLDAIEHVKAAETAQKNVEQWRQELVSERELLAQELRMIRAEQAHGRMNSVVWPAGEA